MKTKIKPNKREQAITTKYVMPWSRAYKHLYPNHIIEVKVVRDGSFLVSQFEEGQLNTLRNGGTQKIADTGTLNMGDIISVSGGVGLLAIWYEKHKTLCIIDIKDYDEEPLSLEMAKTIAKHWYTA